MKKVKYQNEVWTVLDEFHDSYQLDGALWVKKSECEEIENEFALTPLSRIIIVLIIVYLTLIAAL